MILDVNNGYNPYFYLWIVCSVISSVYAYAWDIKMDWGLFDTSAGENKFLREEIVYSNVVSYRKSSHELITPIILYSSIEFEIMFIVL